MARPAHAHPTPAELELLQVLWDHGPMTVRQVMQSLDEAKGRAYTTMMTLLNVMHDKGLVERVREGRAFRYAAKARREQTLGSMVGDLLRRAFDGSASMLVSRLLDQANPSADELAEIGKAIRAYQRQPRQPRQPQRREKGGER